MNPKSLPHCERSAATQKRRTWIASLALAMTLILSVPAFAGDQKTVVRRKSAAPPTENPAFKKLDTVDPKTFNCGTIESPVQELVCKGGLIPSNLDLVRDVNELSISIGKNGKAILQKSQESWRTARNASCELEAYGSTGTTATTAYIACVIKANRDRHQFLQDQIFAKRR